MIKTVKESILFLKACFDVKFLPVNANIVITPHINPNIVPEKTSYMQIIQSPTNDTSIPVI